MSNSLQLQGLQHTRLLCPSLCPGVCSNSCPLSWWCYATILSSVNPVSSCPQSFPAWGSFPVSRLFISVGQSIGALASAVVLSMNIQGWFPLVLTGLISLLSKGLLRVISSTTVWILISKYHYIPSHTQFYFSVILQKMRQREKNSFRVKNFKWFSLICTLTDLDLK